MEFDCDAVGRLRDSDGAQNTCGAFNRARQGIIASCPVVCGRGESFEPQCVHLYVTSDLIAKTVPELLAKAAKQDVVKKAGDPEYAVREVAPEAGPKDSERAKGT